MKKFAIIGIIVAVAILAISISAIRNHDSMNMDGGENSNAPSSSSATETNSVKIQDYAFGPTNIKIKAGTTVTWTNGDDVKHTVTSDDGSTDKFSSKFFGKGETYSYTFKKPGTYTYHCQPHPYMKGTVVVTE